MRFHFGVSKYIKPKKIFEILAFLFVLGLIVLGFVPHAYAWTNLPNNNFFTDYETKIMIMNDSYDEETYTGGSDSFNRQSMTGGWRIGLYQTGVYEVPAKERNIRMSATDDYLRRNGNYITQSQTWFFDNNNYCINNTQDLWSMHFEFKIYAYNLSSSVNYWNDFLIKDILTTLRVKITAYTSQDVPFTTTCNVTKSPNENYRYIVDCPGVYPGNLDTNITHFGITFLNGVPFSNRLLYSNDSFSITYQPMLETTLWHYECNDEVPPNFENTYPFDDENDALNDIYSYMQGNFDTDIPGIDQSIVNLQYPTNFRELMMLPLNVINVVVQNSNSCTPYTIDFSSITKKWGSNNYTLTLPCMRSSLEHHLGIYYNLADMFIAFFVFYNIAMMLILVVDAITSGEDLFSTLFDNHNVRYVDSRTGEVKHYGRR